MNIGSADPKSDMIEPAVQGTLNVMRSCVRAGMVKRVILTSSDASVSRRPLQGGGHVLDESSWSDVEYLRANVGIRGVQGASREGGEQICGGERHQPRHRAARVHLGRGAGLQGQNQRPPQALTLSLLTSDETQLDILIGVLSVTNSVSICQVEDLCRAKVFVAENESSTGRYICCSHDTTLVQLASLLAEKYPQYNVKLERFAGFQEKPRVCLSSQKLIGEGFEFKHDDLSEIFDDLVEYDRTTGILPY
ncbi:unnamed protein product [Triticum aestivum]|uniref:Uncharacterized protein n=1 Tax=Triticum aestivum TaxID=4565 RepID=A0A7H4LNI2_WHEAT|nr:unnamed protein product [Triticum aestivum]